MSEGGQRCHESTSLSLSLTVISLPQLVIDRRSIERVSVIKSQTSTFSAKNNDFLTSDAVEDADQEKYGGGG